MDEINAEIKNNFNQNISKEILAGNDGKIELARSNNLFKGVM